MMKFQKIMIPLWLIGISPVCHGQHNESRHFTVQKLGDGIFAAISKAGGHAICNAGIIDLGDATLIIDPFMNPDAARDLKITAHKLTGKKVKYVVNSHWHDDHTGGNLVFKNSCIISTARTRELIAKNNSAEWAENRKRAPGILESLKKSDTSQMTAFEKEEWKCWFGYFDGVVRSSAVIRTVLPDSTFREKLILKGKKREAVLISHGQAHTESDLFLWLPKENIAFTGDLVFINNQAWTSDGDTDAWKRYLDSLYSMNFSTLVPGHGPIGNRQDILSFEGYLDLIKEAAAACHQKGIHPEQESFSLPEPYDQWHLTGFFPSNVTGEFEKVYGHKAK